ncbi:hypothetical protein [uncultured Pedobacter sp.]|uniref:hypothetical protein n=1 Tax=uncultured Pedobacter sp. TaxID=246139 RepID=UPI002600366C|nr:hypothetical protein [uncultured Pedobacter sp.]
MKIESALIVTLTFLVAIIASCKSKTKQIEIMQQTNFDQAVINDLAAYKKLNNLIVEHLDTIINFRKAQVNHSEEIDEFTFLHDDEKENHFIQQEINFNNVPEFILPKLDSAFYAIKKGKITGFSINRNGMIDMSVGHRFDEKNNSDIYESLVWNAPENLPLKSTAKDTLIDDEWRYIIHVARRGNP